MEQTFRKLQKSKQFTAEVEYGPWRNDARKMPALESLAQTGRSQERPAEGAGGSEDSL